jgi:CRP-like cAMP-binding protein
MVIDSRFIDSVGNFSEQELEWLTGSMCRRELLKDELLLSEGEVCRSLHFLHSGSLVQFKVKDEIDQNIVDLHLPGEWVLNTNSLLKQKPSETIIQAFSDTTIYDLPLEQMHALIQRSPVFFQLAKLIEPDNSRLRLFDDQLNPVEKYQFVVNQRPGLLQAFPLKLIASYLKMTPETLSRVREKIAR